MQPEKTQLHPIIFGEILHDYFPDGKQVLGGAPFNVAWHLHGFGLAPLLVTRIGDDAAGQTAFQAAEQWGLLTDAIQRDTVHPTGRVQVFIDNGAPHFEIPLEQAYDYINMSQVQQALKNYPCRLLYHGTLALRQATSRQTLQSLNTDLPIFLDVNLRAPWWDEASIKSFMKAATWVKLNEDEMALIEPSFKSFHERDLVFSANAMMRSTREDEDILTAVCQQYELAMLVVTLGDKGALLKLPDCPLFKVPTPNIAVMDSVGAGDAFSAVMIAGLIQHWTPEILLKRAVAFAAAICQIRGATTFDKTLYQTTLAQWKLTHD